MTCKRIGKKRRQKLASLFRMMGCAKFLREKYLKFNGDKNDRNPKKHFYN